MRLVAWGRAVKSRRRAAVPPLWLFTDADRTPDVIAAVENLPRGLCGVVFRHDGVAGREAVIRQVARVCRARRLALVVAGRADAPPGVGRHLREGWRAAGPGARRGWLSASAHGPAGLVRARRAGAGLVFLSPVCSRPRATPRHGRSGSGAGRRWRGGRGRRSWRSAGWMGARRGGCRHGWRGRGRSGLCRAESGFVARVPQCSGIAINGSGSRLRVGTLMGKRVPRRAGPKFASADRNAGRVGAKVEHADGRRF